MHASAAKKRRGGGQSIEIESNKWQARRDAGKCSACGMLGHEYKGRGGVLLS